MIRNKRGDLIMIKDGVLYNCPRGTSGACGTAGGWIPIRIATAEDKIIYNMIKTKQLQYKLSRTPGVGAAPDYTYILSHKATGPLCESKNLDDIMDYLRKQLRDRITNEKIEELVLAMKGSLS